MITFLVVGLDSRTYERLHGYYPAKNANQAEEFFEQDYPHGMIAAVIDSENGDLHQ